MSRISRVQFLLFTALATTGVICSTFEVAAQDKKGKKKDDKKVDEKDKKEEKKEVKKDPFKPDPAQAEFKYLDKEKTYWVFAVAFAADGKSVAAAYRDNVVKIW